GQVKLNEPIVKMGRNVKLSGYVGAGYPQPEPRWHPPATGAGDMKVTLDSLNVHVAWAASAAPAGRLACAAVAPGSVGQDRPYRQMTHPMVSARPNSMPSGKTSVSPVQREISQPSPPYTSMPESR